METKVFLLLFALFATSQTAHIHQSNLEGDVLIDALADLLDQISGAVNALNLKLKEIDFSDAGLIKYGQAAGLAFNEKVINLMNALRTDATNTGKVIIDCFEEQRNTVETELNETIKEIGQCAELPMKGVKWYMDEYIEGMDWIYDNLNKYSKDLRACDEKIALTCIIQVIEKNGLDPLTLISFAGGRVIEITIGVVGGIVVVNDLKTCGEQVLDKHLEAYSKQVFNAAVTCIDRNLSS